MLDCGYSARCGAGNHTCRASATRIARYTDNQGRPLRQRTLGDRHPSKLKANAPNVRHLTSSQFLHRFQEKYIAAQLRCQKMELPGDGSINLDLALHMLFFVADLERSLIRMARSLAPGVDCSSSWPTRAMAIPVMRCPPSARPAARRAPMRIIWARSRSGGVCSPARTICLTAYRRAFPGRVHRVSAQRQPSRLMVIHSPT